MRRAVFILAAFCLGAAVPAPEGAPVTLTAQPGSAMESLAISLVSDDLAQARQAGDTPVMLVGSAYLAAHKGARAALFVQVQSASFCGSAGCTTSVFVKMASGWRRVMDSVSGPIAVSARVHGGMHDLLVHGRDRFVWNGLIYKDTLPAPEMKLGN